MARCASAAPAYGSGAYRAFLAALAAGWCVVLLRGFRQCFKELKRFRRAKRSRDHLLAHLPFGVGAAFFLVAALRVGYCAKLLAAARGPACGEDAALHDAAEPLLLVALSSISLYWWQLADSHVARMAPGKLEGKFLAVFVAFNVVFCASGVVAALLARRSDALAARVRAADAALASAAYAAQGLAYVAFGAAKGCEIPNFKGSYLGRFPLVSAGFWTSDHLSERSRSVNAFPGTRARGTLTLKRR